MASFMDISLTGYFKNIFLFLLVYAGVFALIEKSKVFGDKKNLNAIISFVIALFVVLSKPAVNFITFVLPWFFILGLVLLFFIFIGKMFGKSDANIAWALKWQGESPAITWIIIIIALIVIIGFTQMYGQELLEDNPAYVEGNEAQPASGIATDSVTIGSDGQPLPVDTGDYGSNTLATIIHPKVLGMIVLLVTGLAAMLLITKSGFVNTK